MNNVFNSSLSICVLIYPCAVLYIRYGNRITPPFFFEVSTKELFHPIVTSHFRIVRCGPTRFSAAPEYYSTPLPHITTLYWMITILLCFFLALPHNNQRIILRIIYKIIIIIIKEYQYTIIFFVWWAELRLLSVAFAVTTRL